MKITRRKLMWLIKESTNMSGRQFIMDNAPAFKSMGWKIVSTNSGLTQLEYDLPGHTRSLHMQLVIYQEYISNKDNINTYVISSNIKGIWGKEVPIDLTDLTLIGTIIDLINQATTSFGGEIENLKQGIELFAYASEDPAMIKAASLLDETLTPAFL
jgi:hypothetical protein